MQPYKFLTDRALFIPKLKALVIADLHLGIERSLSRAGINIPSQTENLRKRIEKLISQMHAKKLIILGDIKDEYRGLSWQELREAPKFFSGLAKKVELHLVKGNHDGGIEYILPESKKIKIYDTEGFCLNSFSFAHGSANISKELKTKFLLMGHLHPALEFFSAGMRATEPVWLSLHEKSKIIIFLPAFNPLAGGFAVNSKKFKLSGPVSKIIEIKSAEIFLLDGTYLGKLKNLKNKPVPDRM